MRSYEGDINGRFKYSTQYELLKKYGGTVEEEWCWDGCRCCYENNDTYCDHCYETEEEHRNQVEEEGNSFEPVPDGFACRISRDKFNENAVPWLNEHHDFEKYIKHLSYDGEEQECDVVIPKNNEVEFADYLLLKHIQHFFKTDEDDTCGFHADEN